MAARHPISGTAHSCLNDFAELLRKYPAGKAVAKFSKLIKNRKLDVVSKNALCYVTRQTKEKNLGEELLSRVHRAKHLLDSCTVQLSGVASRTLRNKKVVAHPVSRAAALAAIENADCVLLEPSAISSQGVFVRQGARLLCDLAKARGIPVYAMATSWHVVSSRPRGRSGELLPPEKISAVVSEHGVHAFRVFLKNIKKSCPWITSLP
jgi:hypothetical protein